MNMTFIEFRLMSNWGERGFCGLNVLLLFFDNLDVDYLFIFSSIYFVVRVTIFICLWPWRYLIESEA